MNKPHKVLTGILLITLSFILIGCSGSGGDPNAPRNPKADLQSLKISISGNTLEENFKPEDLYYTTTVNFQTSSIRITPEVAEEAEETVEISAPDFIEKISSLSSTSPIPLNIGSNLITIKVTAVNGSIIQIYTVDVTRLELSSFTNTNRLTADIPKANDIFGNQLSLSGNTLAIGAPSSEETETGAVYIFDRDNNGDWGQPVKLTASNAGPNDKYGTSVALSGDTLVVGAFLEDSIATGVGGDKFTDDDVGHGNIGAAYVYKRSPGTSEWYEQAYLKPFATTPQSNRNIQFGSNVAIDGDLIAISAVFDKSAATGINGDLEDRSIHLAGAVFVFTRNNGIWSQDAYIKASNTDPIDQFGSSLAVSGNTIAASSRFEDSASPGINGDQSNNASRTSGAVYVFNRSGTTWTQEAYIKASNPGDFDQFGSSLALDGDTLAVGAQFEGSYASGVATNAPNVQEDNSINSSGAVYVYIRTGNTWSQQAYLKSATTQVNGNFGNSVALSGDMLAVGASGELARAGQVHFFTRNSTDWMQQEPNRSSIIGANNFFGSKIDLDNGLLVSSAPNENEKKGAVYVLSQ